MKTQKFAPAANKFTREEKFNEIKRESGLVASFPIGLRLARFYQTLRMHLVSANASNRL
jgi:hypothetical protein